MKDVTDAMAAEFAYHAETKPSRNSVWHGRYRQIAALFYRANTAPHGT